MPNYGNVAGVTELFPGVQSITTITTPRIDTLINRAEARIDAAIAHRYVTPVSGSPPLLKDIAETLTVGTIIRRFHPTADPDPSAKWIEDATALLEPIATGSATLVASNGTRLDPDQTGDTPWSSTKDFVPTFSSLPLEESATDPDRLDEDRLNRNIR